MMLNTTFGLPISDDAPLLVELSRLVGKPVQVLAVEPDGNRRLAGTLLRVDAEDLPELLGHTVRLTIDLGGGHKAVEIATDRPGTASWDSPRYRKLTITLEDERSYEVADDREIRRLDQFEEDLGRALQLEGPIQRHERLETLVRSVWRAGREAEDPEMRMRLAGLSLFLTEYWPLDGT